VKIAAILSIAMLAATFPAAQPMTLPGTYALQTGKARALATLVARTVPSDPLVRTLDISLGDDLGTIRRYTVDMTKYSHLIIVSDDFETFMHVHPRLHANGHFTIAQRFPRPALYHLYVDTEPVGLGQQVYRFDLDLAATKGTPAARDLSPTGNLVPAGPYRVTLSSTTIDAGGESHLRVHVTENGKPARDLHPYLGALAHAVFLSGSDLTYAHVHPLPLGGAMPGMEMSGGAMEMPMPALSQTEPSSPDMELHVAVKERGTYKLWLQFRGGDALEVAPFVITAR